MTLMKCHLDSSVGETDENGLEGFYNGTVIEFLEITAIEKILAVVISLQIKRPLCFYLVPKYR